MTIDAGPEISSSYSELKANLPAYPPCRIYILAPDAYEAEIIEYEYWAKNWNTTQKAHMDLGEVTREQRIGTLRIGGYKSDHSHGSETIFVEPNTGNKVKKYAVKIWVDHR